MRRFAVGVVTSLALLTAAATTAGAQGVFAKAGAGDGQDSDCFHQGLPSEQCIATGPNGAIQAAAADFRRSTLTLAAGATGQWPGAVAQAYGYGFGGIVFVNNSDPSTIAPSAIVFRFALAESGKNSTGMFYFEPGLGSDMGITFTNAADGKVSASQSPIAAKTPEGYTFTVAHPFTELYFTWGANAFTWEEGWVSLGAQLLGIDALDANGNVYQSRDGSQLSANDIDIAFSEPPSTVPEPSSVALLLTGLLFVAPSLIRRRI